MPSEELHRIQSTPKCGAHPSAEAQRAPSAQTYRRAGTLRSSYVCPRRCTIARKFRLAASEVNATRRSRRAGPGRPRRTSGLAYARRSPCGRPRQEQRDIAPAHAAADVADPAASSPAALRDDRYFPARPSGVRTSAIVGTLTDYGIGTASGALVIRTAAGRTVRFAVAAPPFRVNGRAIDCTVAPRDGVRRASRPHALPELARKPARRSFARARDVLARHAIRKADARHGRDQIAALKTNEAPDLSDASFRVGVGVEVAIVVRYLGGGVARTRG